MYQAYVRAAKRGEDFQIFQDALREFVAGVKELLEEGTSWQVLETTCYIVCTFECGEETFSPVMGFYDCRDLGHRLGILNEVGEVPTEPVPVDEKYIHGEFLEHNIQEMISALAEGLGQLVELEEARV